MKWCERHFTTYNETTGCLDCQARASEQVMKPSFKQDVLKAPTAPGRVSRVSGIPGWNYAGACFACKEDLRDVPGYQLWYTHAEVDKIPCELFGTVCTKCQNTNDTSALGRALRDVIRTQRDTRTDLAPVQLNASAVQTARLSVLSRENWPRFEMPTPSEQKWADLTAALQSGEAPPVSEHVEYREWEIPEMREEHFRADYRVAGPAKDSLQYLPAVRLAPDGSFTQVYLKPLEKEKLFTIDYAKEDSYTIYAVGDAELTYRLMYMMQSPPPPEPDADAIRRSRCPCGQRSCPRYQAKKREQFARLYGGDAPQTVEVKCADERLLDKIYMRTAAKSASFFDAARATGHKPLPTKEEVTAVMQAFLAAYPEIRSFLVNPFGEEK